MQGHVMYTRISGHVTDQVTWSRDLSLSNPVCFLNRKVGFSHALAKHEVCHSRVRAEVLECKRF